MQRESLSARAIYPATGYSHAVRTGPIIWTAGLVAHDAEGRIVGRGDIGAQVEQVYHNLRAVLESCGLGFADVVKIGMFTTSVLFRPVIMEARSRYFPSNPPASTFFVVSSLSTADQLFEMEAVALARD
jgi:enamine deaminase RidA (YjgF/YER057c/UK114 family)